MNLDVLKAVILDQHRVIEKAEIVGRSSVSLFDGVNYIITGLRRAGKSTLLYQKVQDLVANGVSWNQIIYINFEDERLDGFSLSDFNDILSVQAQLSDAEGYFFFDEIQNVEGWEKFARRMADYKEKVCITGSNAVMLSSQMEKVLGGRYIGRNVYPYSFCEYLDALSLAHDGNTVSATRGRALVLRAFEDYLTYGGLPETVHMPERRDYLSTVLQKVLLNDIVARNGIRNVNALRLMVKKLADSLKDELSSSSVRNILSFVGLEMSRATIIDYMSYCIDAYLIFRIGNWRGHFSEKESAAKYYFTDNGILSLFLVDRNALLLENLVAVSLVRKYGLESVFYLKNARQRLDVDFYIPEEGLLVQVAYSLDRTSDDRETEQLVRASRIIKDARRFLILTKEEEGSLEVSGIRIEVLPVWKWLLGLEDVIA